MKALKTTVITLLIATSIISACSVEKSSNVESTQNTRKNINSLKLITSINKATIDATASGQGIIQLSGNAKCDVDVYRISFTGKGVNNEDSQEEGAVFLPKGNDCESNIPLIANGHGTRTFENYDNARTANSIIDIAIYAAHGYAVVSPNYLGLGGSNYAYHPYLHKKTEALSMVNSIQASQVLIAKQTEVELSGKVMLKGYSQGGHTAMAAQQLIEAQYSDEINLVASSPMAGPYLLEKTLLKGIDAQIDNISSGVLLAYIVQSFQNIYGNIYNDISNIFQDEYTETVLQYFPGGMKVFDLILGNFFPSDPKLFLQKDYLEDFQNNPSNSMRVAARKNQFSDDFTPYTPTLLCGSSSDGTVPFFNTTEVAEEFRKKGSDVNIIDVSPYITVSENEDIGLTHHIKANPICNAIARDQLFSVYK